MKWACDLESQWQLSSRSQKWLYNDWMENVQIFSHFLFAFRFFRLKIAQIEMNVLFLSIQIYNTFVRIDIGPHCCYFDIFFLFLEKHVRFKMFYYYTIIRFVWCIGQQGIGDGASWCLNLYYCVLHICANDIKKFQSVTKMHSAYIECVTQTNRDNLKLYK